MITIGLDSRGFEREMERFARKNAKDFQDAITDSTNEMHKKARVIVRNLTMDTKVHSKPSLVSGINQQIVNRKMTGIVISNASYSQAFEEGTRPHTIRIKVKKVLAGPYRGRPAGWIVSKASKAMGYAVYGKKVQHPGTPPHPFMFPAWRFGCRNLEKRIKMSLN